MHRCLFQDIGSTKRLVIRMYLFHDITFRVHRNCYKCCIILSPHQAVFICFMSRKQLQPKSQVEGPWANNEYQGNLNTSPQVPLPLKVVECDMNRLEMQNKWCNKTCFKLQILMFEPPDILKSGALILCWKSVHPMAKAGRL